MPELRAGDILFWNSRVIHGSREGSDPSRSRLSLAAHYIPEGFGHGNRHTPLKQAHPLPVVTGRPIPYLKIQHQQGFKMHRVIRQLLRPKAGVPA
jgi:ectoine hydroxylase-related dioxygenase (phytanoyl-CoA dioxygenase family)